MKIDNGKMYLDDGTTIDYIMKGHMHLTVISRANGKEDVFINGRQWINGKWRVTLRSIWHYIKP